MPNLTFPCDPEINVEMCNALAWKLASEKQYWTWADPKGGFRNSLESHKGHRFVEKYWYRPSSRSTNGPLLNTLVTNTGTQNTHTLPVTESSDPCILDSQYETLV